MNKKIIDFVFPVETEKDSTLVINIENTLHGFLNIIENPQHGSIKIIGENIEYIPNENFVGNDFFSYEGIDDKKGLITIAIIESAFKPRARLLIQLGNQLIKNESIALVELVKNSFDADASYCKVIMQNVDNSKLGTITVEDDGFGMDLQIIKNSWMEPGSDNKAKIVEERILTPKFKRLPIGEKGIGRFGVHKLGKEIELITRKSGNKEIVVHINWEEFEKFKYLKDAPVSIVEREPIVFPGKKTGTKI
jgi:hypothetical protein